ncbi:MAG: hypothetical protein AB7R89_01075 [Dehalococcoidia bacterium]
MLQQGTARTAERLAPAATGHPELLIDQQLLRYDIAIAHAAIYRVPPATCLRAVREVDLFRHPVIRTLFDLRALPQRVADRLAGRGRAPTDDERLRSFRVNDLLRPTFNWLLLAEEPDIEIVMDQIAHPWKPARDAISVAPADFAAFNIPGFAKIALSLRVQPYGTGGTVFTVETRVALIDPESLRRFR